MPYPASQYRVEQLLPKHKEPVNGGQNEHEEVQDPNHTHGKAVGMVLGKALGGDLAEDENHHRNHCRRDGRSGAQPACIGQQIDKPQGGHGGQQDIHDVVSHENGGKQLVVVIQHLKHKRGSLVSISGHILQFGVIRRRESGFTGRKESGKDETNQHNN